MKYFFFFIFLCVFFFVTAAVCGAVGISQAQREFYFSPGDTFDIPLRFTNFQESDFLLSLSGDMAKYASLDKEKATIGPEGSTILATVSIPQNYTGLGGELYITALPADKESQNMMAIKTGVKAPAYLFKKVTGKQAFVYSYSVTQTVKNTESFDFLISNIGTEDIDSAQVSLHIFDASGNEIISKDIAELSLPIKKRERLSTVIPISNLEPGKDYYSEIHADYAGDSYIYKSEEFSIKEYSKKTKKITETGSKYEPKEQEVIPANNKQGFASASQDAGFTPFQIRIIALSVIAVMFIIIIWLFVKRK